MGTTAEAVPAPPSGETAAAAGAFSLLNHDSLLVLMERLHSDGDVRAMICSCRELRDVGEDGLLWRALLAKRFAGSQLCAANLSEWKHAFMLELSCGGSEVACFHTKAALGDRDERRDRLETFGLPLRFTVNPKTRELDYIYSSMDVLCASAFADDKVRTTVWGEPFTHFLPLYLSAEHFSAAEPQLRRSLRDICSASASWRKAEGAFAPEMALDVLPKLLCTMVVLLCDKGVHASDHLIDGYCQVYRLLIAVADRYPRLRSQVTARVRRFIAEPKSRVKSAEPSLGSLVPLLGLAANMRWSELAWPLLMEQLDRGVLWACREHPELATPDGCSAEQRLQFSWEGRRVASRLMAFHYGFLSRLAKLTYKELDAFHGRPSPWLRASLRAHIAKVFAADSWPAFFELINVPLPPKPAFVQTLLDAVENSASKGYHTRGMDFSRVHRSGVSCLLRKGESISASPTMRTVVLEETWRWARGHGTLYLDASCLTYGFDGVHLGTVDYSQTRSVSGVCTSGGGYSGRGGRVAIRHSGDIIDNERCEGKHTINVDLTALSDKVCSMYFTLSAWTHSLREIVRPEVRCFDPADKSGEPLARYELEDKQTGDLTAVIMCSIWRPKPGATWRVSAIGKLSKGRARLGDTGDEGYEPMISTIAALDSAGSA